MKNTIFARLVLLSFLIAINIATANAQRCIWANSVTVDNKSCGFGATVSDAAGDVYSMGNYGGDTIRFGSTALGNPDSNNTYIFIAKYNAAGALLWAKQYGDSLQGASGMAIDGAGNLYLFGNFTSTTVTFGTTTLTNHNRQDYFLLKVDGAGNVVWAKDVPCGPGSFTFNFAVGVATAPGGYVVVTGQFDSSVTFGSTYLTDTNYLLWPDVFVAKYDTAGDVIWATNTSSGYGGGTPSGVAADASGNIYVTGYTTGDSISFGSGVTASTGGTFLVKYNAAGTALWAVSPPGDTCSIATTTPVTAAWHVSTDAAGNVYVFGYFDCPTITFGSITLTNTAPGYQYLFLVKYTGTGAVVWAKGAGGSSDNSPGALLVSSTGSIYVGGLSTSDTLNFGSGIYVALTVSGMFLAKYNSAGDPIWARSANGLNSAGVSGLAQGTASSVYAAGIYNTPTFTLDAYTLSDPASPYEAVFTAEFDDETAGVATVNEELPNITLFPNPATTTLTLTATETITTITISNLVGQSLYSQQYNSPLVQVDVSRLPTGVYFIKINGSEVRKFVKE